MHKQYLFVCSGLCIFSSYSVNYTLNFNCICKLKAPRVHRVHDLKVLDLARNDVIYFFHKIPTRFNSYPMANTQLSYMLVYFILKLP